MINRNRLANAHNRYQNFDKFPRILAVCSAGLLRSPTVAHVLSQEPYNFNTRACGLSQDFALIPIDAALITWADVIIVMDSLQQKMVDDLITDWSIGDAFNIPVLNWNIPDNYDYRDPKLVKIIEEKADDLVRFMLNERLNQP
jgi:predicted protein tyrosine phosphatase